MIFTIAAQWNRTGDLFSKEHHLVLFLVCHAKRYIDPNERGVKWHYDVVLHVTEAQYFDAWSTMQRDCDTMLHLELPNIYVLRVYDVQGI